MPMAVTTPPVQGEALRDYVENSKSEIAVRFLEHGKAATYLKDHTMLIDEVLRRVFDASPPDVTKKVACLAVGGYGRRELFPHSDIDLLFLYEGEWNDGLKSAIDSMLYQLWDLGLQLGYAIRTVEESISLAKQDHTVATNLVDMRYLVGSKKLSKQLSERYHKDIKEKLVGSFIRDKLSECDERHKKHGDSRFLLEPNIKENKGALRDLQMVFWLAKFVYGVKSLKELQHQGMLSLREYRNILYAQRFLWTVRIHLHLGAGRPQERLTFDEQKRIGELLGYRTHNAYKPVERFMKRYFQVAKTIGNTVRTLCAAMEAEHKSVPTFSFANLRQHFLSLPGYDIEGQYLNFDEETDLAAEQIRMLDIFLTAHEHRLSVHPKALRAISRHLHCINDAFQQQKEANALFLKMLLHEKEPQKLLRQMNEAGLLGKFIPDFGKLVAQMQYDMYHIYTVDEHIIHTVGVLHDIECGHYKDELPLASRIMKDIGSRRILYLAMFTHDIAKGRGGNHTHLGEGIAAALAKRFGYSDAEIREVGWLVREHQLIPEIAFKRDLDDPKTIDDFIARVQSPERLRKLLAITVADMRAVGPGIWNGWKGELMRKLYYRTMQRMGAGKDDSEQERVHRFRKQMEKHLQHWPNDQREHYFTVGFPAFWLAEDIDTHVQLAYMLPPLWSGKVPFAFHYEADIFNAITNVTCCMPGHPALMSHIAMATAQIGANIVNARIFTLQDGIAVARLGLQNRQDKVFDDTARLERLRSLIEKAMAGKLSEKALGAQEASYRESSEALKVAPRVIIDNDISQKYSVIEVNGRDRIGLLYDITSAFMELKLTLVTAHISTYGEKAVDVFYVKDAFGLQITHPNKLEQIRTRLTQAVEGT